MGMSLHVISSHCNLVCLLTGGRDGGMMRGRGGGEAGVRVSGLIFKSAFTNGMDIGVSNRTGRSQTASCLMAPKIALHGDFPLGMYHSVSEISDFPL